MERFNTFHQNQMGFVVQRTNHQWAAASFAGLPRSYFHAVQELALKQGWRIEQQGAKFYLRSIEPETFRPAKAPAQATPSNHLAFFNSLGELHEFLTSHQCT
jgi:hypothetical protein